MMSYDTYLIAYPVGVMKQHEMGQKCGFCINTVVPEYKLLAGVFSWKLLCTDDNIHNDEGND